MLRLNWQSIEQGYFWAVKEAKLIEISAVLEGSNELTPTIDAKNTHEPLENTHVDEPVKATQNTNKDKLDSKRISTFIY